MEIWKENSVLYDGKVVRLRVGTVTLDTGVTALREVVEHPGGVCVIPYTGHSVILVRQFRIAAGDYVLEAPAGKLEGDEDPVVRAACELEEETGFRAGRLIPAGKVYSSVGYCTEQIHLFLALDLEHVGQRLEEDERIELVEMPIEDVRRNLRDQAFDDGKTAIVLQALLYHLEGAR
jgi:ADP-ribose pyrophosphatase